MRSAVRMLIGIFFAVAIGSAIATLNWLSISRSFAESGSIPIDTLPGAQQWATVTLVALILALLTFLVERGITQRSQQPS